MDPILQDSSIFYESLTRLWCQHHCAMIISADYINFDKCCGSHKNHNTSAPESSILYKKNFDTIWTESFDELYGALTKVYSSISVKANNKLICHFLSTTWFVMIHQKSQIHIFFPFSSSLTSYWQAPHTILGQAFPRRSRDSSKTSLASLEETSWKQACWINC